MSELQSFVRALHYAQSLYRTRKNDLNSIPALQDISRSINKFFDLLPSGLEDLDSMLEEEFFHTHMSQEISEVGEGKLDLFENLLEVFYQEFKKVSLSYLEVQKKENFDKLSLGLQNWLGEFNHQCFTLLSGIIGDLSEKKTILSRFLSRGDIEKAKKMLVK